MLLSQSYGKRKNICIVTTNLLVVKFFLIPYLTGLSKEHDVTLIVNVSDPDFLQQMNLSIKVKHIGIQRKISLVNDLITLIQLVYFFQNKRFDIVQTIAPKAGLLGILAAWISCVSVRVHIFQGEVWANKKGPLRYLLKYLDKVVGIISTHLIVVSESEKSFLVSEGVISSNKASVLGMGSICGVNMNKFRKDSCVRQQLRGDLNIKDNELVLLYVGRLTYDKGIDELLQAFLKLKVKYSDILLLIVGPVEEEKYKYLNLKGVIQLPYTETPEKFMMASDILILPSHREGFGLVLIEAGAVKLPVIGSRIYGITDAIEDNKTGLLFIPQNIEDLAEKIEHLILDADLRFKMGEAGYQRCRLHFMQEKVVENYIKFHSVLPK